MTVAETAGAPVLDVEAILRDADIETVLDELDLRGGARGPQNRDSKKRD